MFHENFKNGWKCLKIFFLGGGGILTEETPVGEEGVQEKITLLGVS
jgi:hypothetical protein